MRIAFLTGHLFGRAALDGLLQGAQGGLELAFLGGLDPREAASTVGFSDIGDLAWLADAFAYVRKGGTAELQARLEVAEPRLLFVIGWSRLVPASMLDLPAQIAGQRERHGTTWGAIGMHPTLLPEGRGRAPIPWTILRGLERSGVSTFLLEEEADAGGIIAQDAFDVRAQETARTLFEKARHSHMKLGRLLGERLATTGLTWNAQDASRATVWSKRVPQDNEVVPSMSAAEVDRLLRASGPPYPPAFIMYRGSRFTVRSASVRATSSGAQPGTVLDVAEDGVVTIAIAGSAAVRLSVVSETAEGNWPPHVGSQL